MKLAGGVRHLIKDGMYQVFLMTCPATLPFGLVASHPWFVLNDGETVSRYGVGWQKADSKKEFLFGNHHCTDCRAYMHKDGRPPEEGIAIFPFTIRPVWHGRIAGHITGDEHSTAAHMTRTIRDSLHAYPYAERYSLLGPNSNTFVQWILDQFSESGLRLPWNAIGKNYRD